MKKITPKTKPMPKIVSQRVEVDLPFQLDNKELAERGRKAASLSGEVSTKKAELAQANKAAKAKIVGLENELNGVLNVLKEGVETRRVTADKQIDMDKKLVQFYVDGELKLERKIEPWEEQGELFDAPELSPEAIVE